MQATIREERSGDVAAIRAVHRHAFGGDAEGRIVDALRANGAAQLSLVATLGDTIVGHIMFSPIAVGGTVDGSALGPMAVLPEHQRHGIGTQLVATGREMLERAGCPFIIVVGHPRFYPRFGFMPARALGVTCEWDLPDDVFMILPLDPGRDGDVTGVAQYRPEFSAAS
jgi:putative acetyltransferase